jgi:signal transduction histidine kinase
MYAEEPTFPGMRGGRMAPRLPAPAADPSNLLYQFGVGSVTWFAVAIALPFLIWGARRIDAEGNRARVIASVAVVFLVLVGSSATADYLITFPGEIGRPPVAAFLPMAMRRHFLPWAAVAGAVAVVEARRRARVAALERERLRAEAAEQRLVALTGQLQPHFLFNTLQGISTLIHRDPDAADEMLTKLSDLLRDVLRDRDRTRVPLGDELRYARTYLEIAQIRFSQRLSFDIDVPDELSRASVPLFILQPLIENALKHGVGALIRGGHIRIAASRQGQRLNIEVSDDGPGFGKAPPTERVGLGNTRERLRAAFANDFHLSLDARPGGGAVVRIDVPFREESAAPSRESRT